MRALLRAVVLLLLTACPSAAVTTLTTDGGQTITFANSTIGQYANGDYWILVPSGSLTITRTNPVSGGDRHGCEKNFPNLPVWDGNQAHNGSPEQNRSHGFDSRQFGYSASQNSCTSDTVSVATNTTLMIARSKATGETYTSSSSVVHYVEIVEPVTLVSVQPAAGDFRPAFAATSKASPGNKSTIHYERLNNWSAASITGEPTQAQVEGTGSPLTGGGLMRWTIFQGTIGTNRWQHMMPTRNVGFNAEKGAYGRNIESALADVLMWLSLQNSDAVKETMAVRWIQQGIDLFGLQQAGMHFQGEGGFTWPQKSVVLVAASLMNNQTWADALRTSLVGKRWWNEDQVFFTVTQHDIDTPRQFACSDNVHQDQSQCIPFIQADLGKYWWCNNYYHWAQDGSDCSRKAPQNYNWNASLVVSTAFILSKMSLLEEMENPAFYGYLLGVNTVDSYPINGWVGQWFYGAVSTGYYGTNNYPIATTASNNTMKPYTVSLVTAHTATAAIDSSLTPPVVEVVIPTVTITSPSATSETLGVSTVSISGTSASSAGISAGSTSVNGLAATGSTSWSRAGVPLTDHAVNTVTAVTTGDDTGVGSAFVSVLYAATPSTCAFNFMLTGQYPTLPANVFQDQGTGNVMQWTNNAAAPSGVNGRHFAFCPTTVTNLGDDQYSEITINFTPATNKFAYATVQAQGTTLGTYDNCSCTAEAGFTRLAQIVDGVRTQIAEVATTWAPTDRLRASKSGTAMTCLQNDVAVIPSTDSACTLSSGQPGLGTWGDSTVRVTQFTSGNVTVADTTAPMVSFVTPTSAQTYQHDPFATLRLAYDGIASDAVGVTACTYTNSATEASGSTTGTPTSWIISEQDLAIGLNLVRVSCSDAAGNIGIAELQVLVDEPIFADAAYRLRWRIIN